MRDGHVSVFTKAAFPDAGLKKDGTSISQIPSYVTAVPNGTEKVASP